MKIKAILGALALLLVVVMVSGCTSYEDTSHSSYTPPRTSSDDVSSSSGGSSSSSGSSSGSAEAASDCPLCLETGTYQSSSGTYACYDCMIVWIPDSEENVKMYASYSDYIDDYDITLDEIHYSTWNG